MCIYLVSGLDDSPDLVVLAVEGVRDDGSVVGVVVVADVQNGSRGMVDVVLAGARCDLLEPPFLSKASIVFGFVNSWFGSGADCTLVYF